MVPDMEERNLTGVMTEELSVLDDQVNVRERTKCVQRACRVRALSDRNMNRNATQTTT